MALGEIKFLSAREIDQIVARLNDYTLNRAWENWARRAGREMHKSRSRFSGVFAMVDLCL